MSKKTNLSYSMNMPTFLRRMRGELPAEPSVSTKYATGVGPDLGSEEEDETSVPEYVLDGKSITKEEFETMKNGKNTAPGEPAATDSSKKVPENGGKEAADIKGPEPEHKKAPNGKGQAGLEFGSRSSKRKAVAIQRPDSDEDDDSRSRRFSKTKKSKAPVQLSFDEE